MLNAAGASRTAHQERRRAALATPKVNGIHEIQEQGLVDEGTDQAACLVAGGLRACEVATSRQAWFARWLSLCC